MSVELFIEFAQGMTDYIAKHNANYSLIETNLNYILGVLAGQSSGVLAVPWGLQEIFDREGLIGVGSYDFEEGALSGPDYNLEIDPGAYWTGAAFLHNPSASTISMAGRATDTYYVYLDSAGVPAISDTAQDNNLRSFEYNSSTHAVSNKQLYTGVAILFDGDDYADQLTSAARSKTFTRVADRLEEIEQLLGEMGGYYGQGEHDGLDFYYLAGKVREDSVIFETAAGHVTLADDSTNYLEVDPSDGTVSANATGFTSGQIPLYQVVTASGEIDTVTDVRTWAVAGTGGGGGGHTQNTDTGTTASTFTLDTDASGSPTGRAGIEVENGDDPNAAIKFNRDTGQWEYTTDGGTTWLVLGEVDLSLAAQQFTRYVPQENPPEVHLETGRGSSSDYEAIDLSSYLGTPQFGVTAVALRVFFRDTSPSSATRVLFRKGGGVYSPATAFTVWSDESADEPKPADLLIPLGDDETVEFYVYASGGDTANLQVFLLGFFEEVYGVGTQKRTFTQTGLAVAAAGSQTFDLTGFLNRAFIRSLVIQETGGLVSGTYDFLVTGKDTHLDADKQYLAEDIDPASDYEDYLGWFYEDEDGTSELHLKITNNDTVSQATFTITLVAEQFA